MSYNNPLKIVDETISNLLLTLMQATVKVTSLSYKTDNRYATIVLIDYLIVLSS